MLAKGIRRDKTQLDVGKPKLPGDDFLCQLGKVPLVFMLFSFLDHSIIFHFVQNLLAFLFVWSAPSRRDKVTPARVPQLAVSPLRAENIHVAAVSQSRAFSRSNISIRVNRFGSANGLPANASAQREQMQPDRA
jgi:hypothetical protein